jgi:hypothetical protein
VLYRQCNRNYGAFKAKEMHVGQSVITTCGYHKSVLYYSRIMANFCRRSILFSSGDYPRTLSSILSGEGLDESEQGWSPLVFSA